MCRLDVPVRFATLRLDLLGERAREEATRKRGPRDATNAEMLECWHHFALLLAVHE